MEVGILEAKTRLSALVRAARDGESVTITDRGKPVADLRGLRSQLNPEERQAVLDRVRERREQTGFRTTWSDLKQDRDAGRR